MQIVIDFSNREYRLTLNEIFYLDKCFQLLVKEHPEHEWIFDPFEKTKGVISLLPLGIKRSLVLEKLQPALTISTSVVYKKINNGIKQFTFYSQDYGDNRKEGKLLQIPDLVITTSASLKKKMINAYNLDEKRIAVIPPAPSEEIVVADWSEKLSVKDKYSDGREFFLCHKQIGARTNWEEVLKAFSIFKKWQQSSFKMLIVGQVEPGYREEFAEKLGSYKYRADVKVLDPEQEDTERILSTAFGSIIADADHTGLFLLNSFKAEVPAISSPVELFEEEVSGAFLPSIASADELSRQLINLYRDERLREMLIEKGKELHEKYSWKNSVDKWYACIEEAISL